MTIVRMAVKECENCGKKGRWDNRFCPPCSVNAKQEAEDKIWEAFKEDSVVAWRVYEDAGFALSKARDAALKALEKNEVCGQAEAPLGNEGEQKYSNLGDESKIAATSAPQTPQYCEEIEKLARTQLEEMKRHLETCNTCTIGITHIQEAKK